MAVDLSTLTDNEIADLQVAAAKERSKRQTAGEITDAAIRLIETAKNNGYAKTAVKTQLSKIVDDVYAAAPVTPVTPNN